MSGRNPGSGNPLLISHDETYEKAKREFEGMSLEAVKRDRDATQQLMTDAYNEVGDEGDFSKLTVISGATEQEKTGKVVDLNSRLKAANNVLNSKQRARDILVRNARGDGGADGAYERQVWHPGMSMDNVYQFPGGDIADPSYLARNFRQELAKKPGLESTDLRQKLGSKFPIQVEMQIPGDNVFNTLFKRPFANPGASTSYGTSGVTSGWNPFTPREPGYVPILQRPIRLFDIVPIVPTEHAAIEYMEETVFTNAAAATAEGAAAPEATLALNRRVVHVQKIAVHIPVTEEQLDDVPEVNSYLNDRLPLMMMLKAESEVLTADGTGSRIDGYLNRTGMRTFNFRHDAGVGAAVKVTKPIHDMLDLITQLEVNSYLSPEVAFMHNYFLRDLFLQETSSAGFYLGNPQTGFSPTIWGLAIVQSPIFTWTKPASAGNSTIGLVGAFSMESTLRMRRGFMIDIGISGDDFLRGQLRLRGTVRLALKVTRPQGFTKCYIHT